MYIFLTVEGNIFVMETSSYFSSVLKLDTYHSYLTEILLTPSDWLDCVAQVAGETVL